MLVRPTRWPNPASAAAMVFMAGMYAMFLLRALRSGTAYFKWAGHAATADRPGAYWVMVAGYSAGALFLLWFAAHRAGL